MAILPLPLTYYDEAGIIKPPVWLYLLLLANSVDWLITTFAVVSMQHTTVLLGIFYPHSSLLWVKLVASVPFILALLLIGNRERLWKKNWRRWVGVLRLLCWVGIIASGTLLMQQLWLSHWAFHWWLAIQLVTLLLFSALLARSQHLRLMLADWRKAS